MSMSMYNSIIELYIDVDVHYRVYYSHKLYICTLFSENLVFKVALAWMTS